jgi:hypothetical protein
MGFPPMAARGKLFSTNRRRAGVLIGHKCISQMCQGCSQEVFGKHNRGLCCSLGCERTVNVLPSVLRHNIPQINGAIWNPSENEHSPATPPPEMDQWLAAFGEVGQWEDGDCKEREETGGRVNLISRRRLQFDFRLGERKTKGDLFYGL